jgi:putative addiction module component (TIGR02574 family)
VKRGRSLPPDERERLIDQLLESLNETAASELDAALEAAIQRRLDEHDRGESKPSTQRKYSPRRDASPSDPRSIPSGGWASRLA